MNPVPPVPKPEPATIPGSEAEIPGEAAQDSAEASTWRNPIHVLRHRNFRLFLFGLAISQTGSWMENAALQWLAYHITGSKLLLGEVAAAGTAPMVIFSMWGGWAADHYPKRTVLTITQSAAVVTAFAIFLLTWMGVVQPWHIIVVALANGVINGFDLPSRQAFIMEMTSREELLTSLSLNSSVINGTRIIGPAAAGLVIHYLGAANGPSLCFLFNTLSFSAAIIGLMMMRMPLHVRPIRAETPLRQVLSGLVYVGTNFRVRVLMILFTVVGIFGWSYNVLMPAFAQDILNLGPDGFGNLMAASGVGALTGAIIMATFGNWFPKRGTVFVSIWYFSVVLILFSLNRNVHMALALLALNSLGMMIFFSMATTQIQMNVPDEMRGRVMGVWSLMFGAVVPIGSIEAGALANVAGIPATIISGAVICAAAAAVTLVIVQRRNEAKT